MEVYADLTLFQMIYGVEPDSISGRIAGQLYQSSSIAVNGFEKVQMSDSFFDVAIGKVPFGDHRR